MSEVLSLLCMGSMFFIVFAAFVGYQLLKLPLVTNVIYLKLGGAVASDLVADIGNAVAATKLPKDEAAQIVAILTQYNLIPATATTDILVEELSIDE